MENFHGQYLLFAPQYINADLSQKIADYDPTASEVLIPAEKVMDLLKGSSLIGHDTETPLCSSYLP